MARYIDANLLERFFHRDDWDTPDERWRPESEFGRLVDAIPTADCRETIPGEWLPAKTKEAGLLYGLVECSRCLTRIPERYSRVVAWCPQCGAYMNSQRG